MDNEHWKKISQVFEYALTIPKKERTKYIKNLCLDDDELQDEILKLINSFEHSEGFFEDYLDKNQILLAEFSTRLEHHENIGFKSLAGKTIGRWRLETLLGQGGMASVYTAKRIDTDVHQIAAFKIMHQNLNTPENVRRFKLEKQILANLNHPNIANLIDGGINEDGIPYLVMEYVEGKQIIEYCNDNNLNTEQRLKIFQKICDVIQYAHNNLIIHRDIKPQNILISNEGHVKILDFGIAKLLDPDIYDTANLQTRPGMRPMSLEYASPEQINGKNATTASDIYSLGVLLYTLLTNLPPFETHNQNYFETVKILTQTSPLSPSKRIKKSIEVGETESFYCLGYKDPNDLLKKYQGDLDAITLKAIRKEPDQRYRVANELLDDINRYQNGLPVLAREGTLKYHTQKFMGRHKGKIAVVIGILLLLMSFTGFYTWQITEERNQAQLEADKAQEISEFLVGLFEASNPLNSRGDTLNAFQLLQTGKAEIDKLNNQPAVKARILELMGNIYNLLGYPKEADSLLQASLGIKRNLYKSTDKELASIFYLLATAKNSLAEYDEALVLLDTAIAFQDQIYGRQSKEVGESLRLMAESLRAIGNIDSAYTVIKKADLIYKSIGNTTSKEYLGVLMQLGLVNQAAGLMDDAERVWRESLKRSRQLYDAPHPVIVRNIDGLAFVLKETQNFTEAESLYLEALTMDKDIYGTKNLHTAARMNNLAGLYFYTKKYEKAEALFSESYDIHKEILGDNNPKTITILYNITAIKSILGEYETAEENYKKIIEFDVGSFGENHPNVATAYTGLATTYKNQNKYHQALKAYEKSTEIRRTVYENPRHHFIGFNLNSMGEIHTKLGNFKRAEELYWEALVCLITTYDTDHQRIRSLIDNYVHLMELQNRKARPDSLIAKAQSLARKNPL